MTDAESLKRAKPTGARLVYVRTCQMMGISVSQSLYKSLHLRDINLKYHILSQQQFRALTIALVVSEVALALSDGLSCHEKTISNTTICIMIDTIISIRSH